MYNHQASTIKVRTALITLLISLALLALKFYAYSLSGSKAIFSDALESIINVVSAIILVIVTYVASKPPDQNHPYGHGKVEFISAAIEGGAVLFAGLFIFIDATQALFKPIYLERMGLALSLVALAGLINGTTGYYLKKIGQQHHSEALKASGVHLLSDFWTSAGILLGLVLAKSTSFYLLDPIIALIVALHLCREGFKIIINSTSNLMDAEDEQLIKKMLTLFNKHRKPGIIQIHSTRIIRSGNFHHVDAHITIPEFWNIQQGHDFIVQFERNIFKDYPHQGELHFHLDPCREAYCTRCELTNCPIRRKEFENKIEFSAQGITAPDLPIDKH